MKQLKIKKPFDLDGKYYGVDEVLETKNFKLISYLNEKGFIYPLNTKDLDEIKKEINNPKKFIKKEEKEREE